MFRRRQAGIAGRMSKVIVVMVLTSFCSGNMHSESHTPLEHQHDWPLITNEQSIVCYRRCLGVGDTYMEIHSHAHAHAHAYAHANANARAHTYTQTHSHNNSLSRLWLRPPCAYSPHLCCLTPHTLFLTRARAHTHTHAGVSGYVNQFAQVRTESLTNTRVQCSVHTRHTIVMPMPMRGLVKRAVRLHRTTFSPTMSATTSAAGGAAGMAGTLFRKTMKALWRLF